MKLYKLTILFTVISFVMMFIVFDKAYAEESETIQVEIKYTNGDRADFNSMKILVYQDFSKEPLLEKKIENNPDIITVPENHKYKIEVYANGMYADVGYIQLDRNAEKINITIPLSGGLQFEIYYKNGETPIEGATLILKSQDKSEWARGITNDQGETPRYWIQSTTKQTDHYIADVYLDDLFLTTYSPIKVEPGIAQNQKILVNIPKIVEELISINLYDGNKKIKSSDGNYKITLRNSVGEDVSTSMINFRGDAQFSNLKSGSYTIIVSSDNKSEDIFWPQTKIHIIGDQNKFNIFKKSQELVKLEKPFLTCNCISFRLDDVQDYWLADTQLEIIKLFDEKNVPLNIGIIGNLIGDDERIISAIKENLKKNNIELSNHSWNNDSLINEDERTQEKYIMDTNKKIMELFSIAPTSFIPPQNLYDKNTIQVLKRNGFTHLISHVEENNQRIIDNSFYVVPAATETGTLIDGTQWKINENNSIIKEILQNLKEQGYVIIMMHPQEFSLNENGEYDIPNEKYLSELSNLLDEVSKLDAKIVKISDVKPIEDIKNIVNETQIVPDEKQIDSCNCVAFRLDDVQDYWLNKIQMKIMETFIENKIPLTIGIIANAFGNDESITEFVKQNIGKEEYLKVATKGVGLTPFTNYDKTEQNENLSKSIDLIESTVHIRPNVFIPPENKFNSETLEILGENNITHISSSIINGDSPPFDFQDKKFYRFPQITSTGEYNISENIFEGVSGQKTMSESIQGINDYGFAVITLHPQEFSVIDNSTYTNSINEEQFDELKKLIAEFSEKGIKIVPIEEINSNLVVNVPSWIKNNAGWWAEGSIDDETFVQGIEYLVQEEIIKVSEQSQTSYDKQNVPSWIKNNAGWWAEGSIDDETFVQGIEYLVKTGIITY
ncbi:MAG: polysaccharide deacetylase family protein [Nitrosopumilus sp.]